MEQNKLKLIVIFARYWGIAAADDFENGGDVYKILEEYDAEDLANLLSSWADEFVQRNLSDYDTFFDEKMSAYVSALDTQKASDSYPVLYGYAGETTKELRGVQEVADFIMEYGLENDITITREGHVFFLNTFGIFINRIVDMDYRDELMRVLVPMQEKLLSNN